ncbi:immunoglobulin kappa light chain-like [Parambassis ranga]|uniref:immunoglobulin kappa light chain-like n=1 Tax=Parambassis ranga TaxID=210632 RepID=UPI0010424C34|nr:immunoglobulin kappa light chain-like [Parambassis ranga]
MASPVVVLCLSCLLLGKTDQTTDLRASSTHQDIRFMSADVGDKLTLQCFFKGESSVRISWYKQTLGHKPRLISSFSKSGATGIFYNEFNNSRFTLDGGHDKAHLTISDLHISDSASYYCISYMYTLEFLESVIVSVKGSSWHIQALVHQSASESAQRGGSVTLNCTAHTGTYYCGSASCGQLLLGNGTFEGEMQSLVWVYFLSAAVTFTSILTVLLSFLLYKTNRRNSCQSKEATVGFSAPSTYTEDADSLHYAALKTNVLGRSRSKRNNNHNECVYASVNA